MQIIMCGQVSILIFEDAEGSPGGLFVILQEIVTSQDSILKPQSKGRKIHRAHRGGKGNAKLEMIAMIVFFNPKATGILSLCALMDFN